MGRKSGLECVDCGVDTGEISEYYMVTDACWARAGMNDGCLCIGCLEERLGKRLTARNFSECPLNWRNTLLPGHASPRLTSRLFGTKTSKWGKTALELLMNFDGDEEKFSQQIFELTLWDYECADHHD
jgi:hypothetical protein